MEKGGRGGGGGASSEEGEERARKEKDNETADTEGMFKTRSSSVPRLNFNGPYSNHHFYCVAAELRWLGGGVCRRQLDIRQHWIIWHIGGNLGLYGALLRPSWALERLANPKSRTQGRG